VSGPRRLILGGFALFAAATLSPAGGAYAAAFLPDFGAATFIPGDPIDNPWFPMTEPAHRVFVGEALRGHPVDEGFELTNIGAGPTILGVQTQVQFDQAFEDGLLVESTRDYFAQDSVGNVWYFGEDVTSFTYDKNGNLVGTDNESAWRAGVNGALPGFIMPVDQTVGFNYYQEFAGADDALDQATVFATGLTLMTEFGELTNVLQVLETSELDPKARGFKYYAPGLGLILEEEGLNPNFKHPRLAVQLVSSENTTLGGDLGTSQSAARIGTAAIPEPASWAMMILGFGLAGAALRHRKVRSKCAWAGGC
jgi:hypothetical protein